MYSSRGGNAYGQRPQQQQLPPPQQYSTAPSVYRQNLGSAYSGSSGGGQDGGASQLLSMTSRHSAILGANEADMIGGGGGYRAHSSAAAAAAPHYGGQYSSVYGSAALTTTSQQVPSAVGKGSGPAALEGRRGYTSAMPESPKKFISADYVSSSSHGYGQKGDQLYADKISDYPSIDRRKYGERSSAFLGREQTEPAVRYVDSFGYSHQRQPDLYDRIDQASVLRQEQMMKAQSMQSNSLDGGSRQADYLSTRGASIRLPAEDHMSYGGRMDADPRILSSLGSSHGGPHAPSILGAAPRRNVDDLVFAQSSSNPGYGVSLPPGRDYATGKGLHAASIELDYPGSSLLSRGSLPRIDDRKDERGGYAWELERREEERRRDNLREREKDRERDKERERERERERQRRREKEKDREIKRVSMIRHERTPPRISRDHRGSSLSKEGRSLRRESPRYEVLHRRHSPVKEKRRDYVCKVQTSSLLDAERDYLSIDKRYPRLFISPECSKVVVHWPRENLKLSIHTPVSFEHDFVEDEESAEKNVLTPKPLDDETLKLEREITVWNAKMILMSGLSQNALEELSSERSYDDRIPHFCNTLRFALLKKENAFMAIGGPWDTVDGGDPSVDDSSLIQTAIRYANSTGLDLKNCRQWNRFLEIHYDRTGKNGLFSHKEVTVLYVPDLSECLPSLETWRDQWLTHKKTVAERERQLALKNEKPREKKKEEGLKDKEPETGKYIKSDGKPEKEKVSKSGKTVDTSKKEKVGNNPKGTAAEKVGDENGKKVQKVDAVETEEGNSLEKKEQGEGSIQTSGVKSGKKIIVKKKIVKQKVVDKKTTVENAMMTNEKLEKDVEEKSTNSEVTGKMDVAATSPAAVKTFIRKKVVKKVQVTKSVEKDNEGLQPEVKHVTETEGSEDKSKELDSSSPAGLPGASRKTTVKKKIIKRVPKRKSSTLDSTDGNKDSSKDCDKDGNKLAQSENEIKITEQTKDSHHQQKEVKPGNKASPKTKLKQTSEKLDTKKENKTVDEVEKEDKKDKVSSSIGVKKEAGDDKQKVILKDGQDGKSENLRQKEKLKDEKQRKDCDGKEETRSKSGREVKEKKKPDELPRHPGLLIRTKGSKNSKLRSLSLSLDSLLDYSDKDIEESNFELSIFAETLYEMLQYQMSCRLFTFLQKLRIKFVTKRNKRKRQREESARESDQVSPRKRVKKEEKPIVEVKSIKTKTEDESLPDPGKNVVKEGGSSSVDEAVKVKPEKGTYEDEDPEEEDSDEDEEMPDGSPQHDSTNEEKDVDMNTEADSKSEKATGDDKDEQLKTTKEKSDTKNNSETEGECKPDDEKAETSTKKKETQFVVDKELLQAFRFFDRNRVGYIRVEDLRLIIHNLGMFLSHRDVKELVQSALLESNTGRNDQILYNKLVRMSGI